MNADTPIWEGRHDISLAVLNPGLEPFTDPRQWEGALLNRVTKSNQWLPFFKTIGMVYTMLFT